MGITFSFDNVNYTVSWGVYRERGFIRLPDGRIFDVGWVETSPPQPENFNVVSQDAIQDRPIFNAKLV